MIEWKVVPEKTEDHWLEVVDPDGWYSAVVKWDGCVHFRRYHNIPLQDRPSGKEHMELEDYLHMCDIDEEIERLQKLKEAALKHFGEDWPC